MFFVNPLAASVVNLIIAFACRIAQKYHLRHYSNETSR